MTTSLHCGMTVAKDSGSTTNYKGELAEPLSPVSIKIAKHFGCLEEWLAARHDRLMGLLVKHYKIPASDLADAKSWMRLAILLAHEHVPAFQVSDKRPAHRPSMKDLMPQDLLFMIADKQGWKLIKRKPGRPSIWNSVRRAELCWLVDTIKQLDEIDTDKEALRILITRLANKEKRSVTQALNSLPNWQSRLSRARKELQNPS